MASRYPGRAEPLWNLPGGRHEPPETSAEAALRELHEETGLAGTLRSLAYVAESFDHATRTHWTSLCFRVDAEGDPAVPPGDLHAVSAAWVARDELAERLRVAVVREPLLAHLADPQRRYFGFADAGITVRFVDDER